MNRKLVFALVAASATLPAQGLTEGRAGSPVRVLIYEDLQCPDCANFRVMMDQQVLPKYSASVEFVHRDFPLAKHAWARRAAIAARFFTEKDPKLGLEFRRYTMANIPKTNPDNFNARLAEFASQHDLKPADALAALDNPKYAQLVEKDFQEGVARGVIHTPTVFVNGQAFIERFSFEDLSKGIEEALGQSK
jgi:protein-disulfide isomerase